MKLNDVGVKFFCYERYNVLIALWYIRVGVILMCNILPLNFIFGCILGYSGGIVIINLYTTPSYGVL